MVTNARIGKQRAGTFANASSRGVIMPAPADRPRYYSHIPRHPSQGLTPSKLMGLLQRAERGDMEAQAELVSDVLEKEPTLIGLFQSRAYGVLSKRWEVMPNEGATKSRAERQAKWLSDVLRNLSLSGGIMQSPGMAEYLTFDELREYLISATAYGYAVAFLDWDAKDWTVTAARSIEHKHFVFGNPSLTGSPEYNPYELRYKTLEDEVNGVTLEPNQAIVHLYKASPVLPARFGLIRRLVYWYMFKLRAMSAMVRYGERFSEPLTIGYYDPNNDLERASIEAAVQALGQEAAVAMARAAGDTAERIQFVEPSGTSVDTHERILKIVNDEYAKCVLGHASAAEPTPNKLGEETHAIAAQNARIERDAIALDLTLTEQLLRPMAEANDGELLCHFKTKYEAEENQNEKAERFQKLAMIQGFEIPAEHIAAEFNIPMPKDGEKVVGTPALTDPAAIMAQAAARSGAQQGAQAAANTHTHPHSHPTHFANTTKPGFAARRALTAKLREQEDAELGKLMRKAEPVYASLLNGVKPTGDVRAQIRANLDGFREEFEPIVREACRRMGNAALKAYGLGDIDETGDDVRANSQTSLFANADDPFKLRDAAASKFLDWQAFTMTVVEGEKITEDLFERIGEAVKNGVNKGISQREFMKQILDESGLTKTNGGHMQTVFRTNLATAMNASKLYGMAKHASEFPGWQFLAIDDTDTTEDCRTLNGQFFAATDRKNFPPLHFNCRSEGVPVGRDEWEAEGYAPADFGAMGDEGFENTAVKGFNEWVASERKANPAINDIISQKEKST